MTATTPVAWGPAPAAAELRPVGTEPPTVLRVLVGATVALMPFLVPAGPGNSAPADLTMVAAVAVAVLWLVTSRTPVSLPYSVGVTGLLLGGALGATVSNAPASVLLVLAQDVLLLMWACVLALGQWDVDLVRTAAHVWCRTATVYSAVMVVAYLVGLGSVAGVSAVDGVRASYTFGDPNLAGNYLLVSLLVMVACRRPRATPVRWAGYVAVLVAIVFTGSNGASLCLVVATATCVVLATLRTRGAVSALAVLGATLVVTTALLVLVLPKVDLDGVRSAAAGSVPLLRDSFGRSGGSTSERAMLVESGSALYLRGDGVGYGPALTKATLRAEQAPYVKEAHDDYLAALLERGVVGLLGLVLLGCAATRRAARVAVAPLPASLTDVVPRAWVLAAALPVTAMAGTFYETLHFRHVWAWLGILAAIFVLVERPESRS